MTESTRLTAPCSVPGLRWGPPEGCLPSSRVRRGSKCPANLEGNHRTSNPNRKEARGKPSYRIFSIGHARASDQPSPPSRSSSVCNGKTHANPGPHSRCSCNASTPFLHQIHLITTHCSATPLRRLPTLRSSTCQARSSCMQHQRPHKRPRRPVLPRAPIPSSPWAYLATRGAGRRRGPGCCSTWLLPAPAVGFELEQCTVGMGSAGWGRRTGCKGRARPERPRRHPCPLALQQGAAAGRQAGTCVWREGKGARGRLTVRGGLSGFSRPLPGSSTPPPPPPSFPSYTHTPSPSHIHPHTYIIHTHRHPPPPCVLPRAAGPP